MYQALYRKWRPRTFDDVAGQPHITETLKNQVRAGRTSHAYLFIGSRGTGKTTCARILAKAVNCEHPVDGNPCNACRICRGIDDGSIMDVVEMDAASNNGVDNVRALRDEAVFSPATAKKRVYIIDEVHMLSGSAFNALLKILEEPPEHLMFILATTELSKVPATILSRCQRHSFRRLDTESIEARLRFVAEREGIPLTDDAARLIAVRSEGGMRDALSMLDQCAGRERIDADTVCSALGLAGARETAGLLRLIAARDSAGAIAAFNRLWAEGKDPAALLGELATLLRDLLLDAVAPGKGRALRSGSFDDDILDAFRGVFPAQRLIADVTALQGALGELRAGQAKMRCELTLITLCEPELNDSVPALRGRVAALEQALRLGAQPAGRQTPPDDAAAATPLPVGHDAHIVPKPASRTTPPDDAAAATPPPVGHDAHIVPKPASRTTPPDDAAAATPPPVGHDAHIVPPVAPTAQPGTNAPTPVAAPAAPAPADAAVWETARARLRERFPMGTAAILADDLQVRVRLCGDTLKLAACNDFARNMVDRPDVLASLAALVSEAAGRPVRVESISPDAPELQRSAAERDEKLDALRQFDIVQFKDSKTEV